VKKTTETLDAFFRYACTLKNKEIVELKERVKELEQESEAVRQHIKLMFPCTIASDGALIVDVNRYNDLVDILNNQVGDV
jgi:hypothetical protein